MGVIIKVSAEEGVNSDWGGITEAFLEEVILVSDPSERVGDHEADRQRVGRKQSPRQREEGSEVMAPEGTCLVAGACGNQERSAGDPPGRA